MSWLAITIAVVFLLTCGVGFSAVLTILCGRIVFGGLWKSMRIAMPRLRFKLVELFALFLVLQLAIALTQTIWPVIQETSCAIVKIPQVVETELSVALAPRGGVDRADGGETVDRITASAFPCGVALCCWLLALLLIEANHVERIVDRLIILLLVAPLGTTCVVFFLPICAYFLIDFATPGDPLPPVDSLLWHGVVLVGGSLLGVIYCRGIGAWLVLRANRAESPKTVSTAKGT